MTNIEQHLNALVRLAIDSGASRAATISTAYISAEEKLSKLCSQPKCKNYGLSRSCPPYVTGPEAFNKYLTDKKYAIVIRIDLSTDVLFSEQRAEIMYLLHEITAKVEKAAITNGFSDSKAFAGSSCKKIFCRDEPDCLALSANGECRHPDIARPSMSGYGINVSKLMAAAGWPAKIDVRPRQSEEGSMSWVAGLIVIG